MMTVYVIWKIRQSAPMDIETPLYARLDKNQAEQEADNLPGAENRYGVTYYEVRELEIRD